MLRIQIVVEVLDCKQDRSPRFQSTSRSDSAYGQVQLRVRYLNVTLNVAETKVTVAPRRLLLVLW